jgi:type IV pilus assembly protein PilC
MAGKSNRTIESSEVASFCSQVALILEAGLPLYDGLESMFGSAKGSAQEELYRSVHEGMNETGTLYGALKKDDSWPTYMVELVGIGEQTGQLEYVMKGLTDYYERESRIRSAVVHAVTYPLVLGVLLVVIVLTMVWKVLPVFQRVLNSMGMEMNGAGNTMIRLGSVIGWVVLVLVAVVVIAVIVCVILMKGPAKEKVLGLLRKLFPSIRKLDKKLNTSRVASVLSIMLSSGFPSVEALRILPAVLSNSEILSKVSEIRNKLEAGEGFADAITDSKLFPGIDERMIRVGTATGREDQVMRKIADRYEEDVEDGISRLVAVIEPTLIAMLAVVIGAILLSVMFPMIGILSNSF